MKAPRASICALKGSVNVVPVRPIGAAVSAHSSEHARGEPRPGSPRAEDHLAAGLFFLSAEPESVLVFLPASPPRGSIGPAPCSTPSANFPWPARHLSAA